jgi:hypothetical protein
VCPAAQHFRSIGVEIAIHASISKARPSIKRSEDR